VVPGVCFSGGNVRRLGPWKYLTGEHPLAHDPAHKRGGENSWNEPTFWEPKSELPGSKVSFPFCSMFSCRRGFLKTCLERSSWAGAGNPPFPSDLKYFWGGRVLNPILWRSLVGLSRSFLFAYRCSTDRQDLALMVKGTRIFSVDEQISAGGFAGFFVAVWLDPMFVSGPVVGEYRGCWRLTPKQTRNDPNRQASSFTLLTN
jgi:hypothetical protein